MTASPLPLPRLVNLIDDSTYDDWADDDDFAATVVVVVDVGDLDGRNDLFERVRLALGLGDDVGLRTWSGLEDHLWSAVAQHERTDATIVIRHADAMVDELLEELLELVSILTDVATQASGADDVVATNVCVVLTGENLSFPMQLRSS